jgi:hypothetical protein
MARILDCWELGNGLAYIEGLSVGCKLMAKAGHEVHFAARDLTHAERIFGDKIPYYQAPTTVIPNLHPLPTPMGFADVLINLGYGNPGAVVARVRAWRRLLDQVRPDILRCTHSPAALLAARGTGIRTVAMGIGFLVPPPVSPLPILRSWAKKADPERIGAREQAVLDGMNQALNALGAPRISGIGALYAETDARLLWTFPELDDYGPREDVKYLGNYQPGRGAAPVWPSAPGKRVFAYMEHFKELPEVLLGLAAGGHSVLVYLPYPPEELQKRYANGNLRIVDQPLDLMRTAQECDVGVSRGGHNIVSTFLYAGKPQLTVPLMLPEHITAIKLKEMGMGLRAAPAAKDVDAALLKLAQEPSFAAKAREMATRIGGLSMEAGVKGLMDVIETLAKAGPKR